MSENRRQHLFDSNVFLTLDLLWAKDEVDPYYRARKINGEFYRNYEEQRQNPDKFYDYTRMSVETFDYILETVKNAQRRTVTARLECTARCPPPRRSRAAVFETRSI
ncbi:hypothetical protein ACJJTC_013575 [Scirpophaga incertulas]